LGEGSLALPSGNFQQELFSDEKETIQLNTSDFTVSPDKNTDSAEEVDVAGAWDNDP
jgi:hypothetical protein